MIFCGFFIWVVVCSDFLIWVGGFYAFSLLAIHLGSFVKWVVEIFFTFIVSVVRFLVGWWRKERDLVGGFSLRIGWFVSGILRFHGWITRFFLGIPFSF